MDKAPLPRLSCEPLISDQNYCLQQYSLLDVPKLSPACCQVFCLRLPDLPSYAEEMSCSFVFANRAVAEGLDLASSKPRYHFQAVPTLGVKYCFMSQGASEGLCFYVLPNPVPRESHSRSDRQGSGKVKNNFSLSGML